MSSSVSSPDILRVVSGSTPLFVHKSQYPWYTDPLEARGSAFWSVVIVAIRTSFAWSGSVLSASLTLS